MTDPLVITPPEAIISAADAKARVPALAGAADAVVDAQIAVATVAAQNYIGKAIGVQTLEWRPEECVSRYRYESLASPYWATNGPWGWRGYGATFALPMPPLVSVTSLKYLDSDGVEQTYDAANYIVSGVGGRGRITLKSGSTWPTVGAYPEALRIRFVAGYVTVPEPIEQAILLDAAEAIATTAESSVLSGSGTVRSLALEGVGTVTYATPSASTSNATGAASLFVTSQRLLAPYREF